METTNAGYNCNDSREIFEALEEMYLEFLQNGEVASKSENYEQFSRKDQAKLLAEIIHQQMDA